MGVTPIAPRPRPLTEMQRFERDLRRGLRGDSHTEWLNLAGVVLVMALFALVGVLVWMAL